MQSFCQIIHLSFHGNSFYVKEHLPAIVLSNQPLIVLRFDILYKRIPLWYRSIPLFLHAKGFYDKEQLPTRDLSYHPNARKKFNAARQFAFPPSPVQFLRNTEI